MRGSGQQLRAPAAVLALVAFIALSKGLVAATNDAKPGEGCVCPALWAPVCGEDGKTYSNSCEAACAGKAVSYQGPCADPSGCAAVLCSQEFAPVCGNNNVTYSNKCMADCTGVYIQYEGECGDPVKPISDDAFPTCPPAGPGVQCLVDPCTITRRSGNAVSASRAVCPSAPGAVCHSNYCAEAVYRGTPLGPCAAVWLDPVSGDIVDCKGGPTDGSGSGGGSGELPGDGIGEGEGGASSGSSGSGGDEGCACPLNYQPVCAKKNGKLVTYGNACAASCDGARFKYDGACADPAGCAAVTCPAPSDDPAVAKAEVVCGNDGVEYPNDCLASCTGVTFFKGPCGSSSGGGSGGDGGAGEVVQPLPATGGACACNKMLKPVCAKKDGVLSTYSNECMAKCAGAVVEYEGACADPAGCAAVRCITEDNPVCGNDGVEYRNECFAACTGVTFSKGPCQTAPTDGGNNAAKGGKKGGGKKPGKKPSKKSPKPGGRRNGPSPDAAGGPKGKVDASKCQACANEPLSPVCGSKFGITYGNACLARCSGETQYTEGECVKP